ncbi:class I SAM-dependent methyltransferase [Nocardioides caricicola]|uniref:Class I SAM-dependent methyltransferase n=1 Tax=Nocardioides caricicola TaxID=634770 RepID=A0ABW0N173_9ACTN
MPRTMTRDRFRATLRRSVRLLREFRYEQPDPARFYTALAEDSAAQLDSYVDLDGAVLLDVGGGPGYFRTAFQAAGATYYALDSDVGELSGLGGIESGTVIGSGMQLPFRDGAVDVCYSSNVLEHVPAPWQMADEMLRVTRPGGTVFISYTVWYGPWGGHETAPWHFLGGARARRRYAARHGHEPKNKYGESLFSVTVRDGLRWARAQTAGDVVAVIPRYNPWWSHWLVRVPLLREVVTWNLVLVLRKR